VVTARALPTSFDPTLCALVDLPRGATVIGALVFPSTNFCPFLPRPVRFPAPIYIRPLSKAVNGTPSGFLQVPTLFVRPPDPGFLVLFNVTGLRFSLLSRSRRRFDIFVFGAFGDRRFLPCAGCRFRTFEELSPAVSLPLIFHR